MKSSFQNVYETKIGTAKASLSYAVAGSTVDLQILYKAGELGIDDSGSMKVLTRIVSDCGEPQFDNPKASNYVYFESAKTGLNINVAQKSSGVFGKVHERPWSKGFVLVFSGESFSRGDELSINFRNWKVQTFIEKEFKFKILVDPFASLRYLELTDSPSIGIVAGEPSALKVIAPSVAETGKKFNVYLKLEDSWGNACTNFDGEAIVDDASPLKIKNKVRIRSGKAVFETTPLSDGTVFVHAFFKNLKGVSNPVVCTKKPKARYYWGDFHGQSEETVGTNDIDEYFKFARDYALLDFAGHQANDFQVTQEFWKKINKTTKEFTKGGKFVAIPGYEWSGNTPVGGDRNVLYLNEYSPIYRSSHALLDDFSDINDDVNNVYDLFKKLKGKNALTLAHVGGRYANLEMHDESVEPGLEIHSDWGTFEWFLFEALKKGYKVGVLANSDCHDGRPGASYPGMGHFYSRGGITCVISPKLDRKSIFKALKKRHVYATTGERVYLDVGAYKNGSKVGMMGDEIKVYFDSLIFKVASSSAVDRVEVFDGDKVIRSFYPTIQTSKRKAIKVAWMGSNSKGRKRGFPWKGQVKLEGNKAMDIEIINFYNKYTFEKSTSGAKWTSLTTGGNQGIIFYLSQKSGKLDMEINGKEISVEISTISQKQKSYDFGGLDARAEIYEVSENDNTNILGNELSTKALKSGKHAVFVKTTFRNGTLAWSSPIYFTL